MNKYKDLYQNLMNIMNTIQDIQKLQVNVLSNPLNQDINMNHHNILNTNIIETNTLSSSNIITTRLSTNTITPNYPSGILISGNYPSNSGTVALLTVIGQTTGSLSYQNNDIFKVNNDGSVVIGSYNTSSSALTVYGSIHLHGPLNSTNIISSVVGDADNGPGSIISVGTYAQKTLKLANPINNLTANTGNINSLYINSFNIDNITPTSATIGNIYSTSGTIGNLNTTSNTISNLYNTFGTVGSLSAINGTISNLYSTFGTVGSLSAISGTISNLYSTTGTVGSLNAISGTISNLYSTSETVSSLSATSGTISNLYSTSGTVGSLNATNGTMSSLYCNSASISNLINTNCTASSIYTSNLKVNLQSGNSTNIIGVDISGNINYQPLPSAISVISGTTYNIGYNSNIAGSTLTINMPNQSGNTDAFPLFKNLNINTITQITNYPITRIGTTNQYKSTNNVYFTTGDSINASDIRGSVSYNIMGKYVSWLCTLSIAIPSNSTLIFLGGQFGTKLFFNLPLDYSNSNVVLNNQTSITELSQFINMATNTVNINPDYDNNNYINIKYLGHSPNVSITSGVITPQYTSGSNIVIINDAIRITGPVIEFSPYMLYFSGSYYTS
jgi:hypothetical protein